jgi:ZIP family zinc transporter
VTPEAAASRTPPGRTWLVALVPLALLGALVAVILWWGPADALRGDAYPPVEILTFERVELGPDGIRATVMNDGPDPVTVAQVQVDDAYWQFSADRGTRLGHLGRTTLHIPYPWVHGEAHALRIVSSSGVTFDHEIAVAVETPRPGARALWVFTLMGVYVGVLPVAIGLLWFPLVAQLGKRGLDFLLALTIGLLLFLLVDAVHDGLGIAALTPGSYQGVALFVFGALGAYLALETLGTWLRDRRGAGRQAGRGGWVLALLVAIGIGLHNFGEGLAIGSAFALGEAALGTLLIVGFTLHNTTEGLAIVAPLARERAHVVDLIKLGLVGGAPTIAGAWLGGFVYVPLWSVFFLAIGAGAIAQVVVQIGRQMAGDVPVGRHFATAHVSGGLLAGFAVMYATGMLVG